MQHIERLATLSIALSVARAFFLVEKENYPCCLANLDRELTDLVLRVFKIEDKQLK